MAEYIDREDLIAKINTVMSQKKYAKGSPSHFVFELFTVVLKGVPTADVVEVKHGKWIYNVKYYSCSICAGKRFNLLLGVDAEYCPYCGAKMDLKEGAEE